MLEMDQLTEPTLMAASLKDLKVHWTLSDSTHLSHFFSLQLILFFITLPEVRMHTHTHTHTHTRIHHATLSKHFNTLLSLCWSTYNGLSLSLTLSTFLHVSLPFRTMTPKNQHFTSLCEGKSLCEGEIPKYSEIWCLQPSQHTSQTLLPSPTNTLP